MINILRIVPLKEEPLKNAGFETEDVIEEWHDLISYAIAFLNCSSTNYLRTWHRILSAFCLPVSTAKLERSFSMLKRVKRDTRAALGVNRVENLTRIFTRGTTSRVF